jgi:hypothetical protein
MPKIFYLYNLGMYNYNYEHRISLENSRFEPSIEKNIETEIFKLRELK